MTDADGAKHVRKHLIALLEGGNAHVGFEAVTGDIPPDLRGHAPGAFHRTPWQIVEHMRLCQRDILDYLTAEAYEEPAFPDGVWPATPHPPSADAWEASLAQFQQDLAALRELVADPATDLDTTVRATTHTILREVLIVADHNAYHIGQLVLLRQALGIDTPEIAFS